MWGDGRRSRTGRRSRRRGGGRPRSSRATGSSGSATGTIGAGVARDGASALRDGRGLPDPATSGGAASVRGAGLHPLTARPRSARARRSRAAPAVCDLTGRGSFAGPQNGDAPPPSPPGCARCSRRSGARRCSPRRRGTSGSGARRPRARGRVGEGRTGPGSAAKVPSRVRRARARRSRGPKGVRPRAPRSCPAFTAPDASAKSTDPLSSSIPSELASAERGGGFEGAFGGGAASSYECARKGAAACSARARRGPRRAALPDRPRARGRRAERQFPRRRGEHRRAPERREPPRRILAAKAAARAPFAAANEPSRSGADRPARSGDAPSADAPSGVDRAARSADAPSGVDRAARSADAPSRATPAPIVPVALPLGSWPDSDRVAPAAAPTRATTVHGTRPRAPRHPGADGCGGSNRADRSTRERRRRSGRAPHPRGDSAAAGRITPEPRELRPHRPSLATRPRGSRAGPETARASSDQVVPPPERSTARLHDFRALGHDPRARYVLAAFGVFGVVVALGARPGSSSARSGRSRARNPTPHRDPPAARRGRGGDTALAATATPAPRRAIPAVAPPCALAGPAHVVAPHAVVQSGVEAEVVGSRLAVGFATREHEGFAVALEPTTLTAALSARTHTSDPIRRVVPIAGAHPGWPRRPTWIAERTSSAGDARSERAAPRSTSTSAAASSRGRPTARTKWI